MKTIRLFVGLVGMCMIGGAVSTPASAQIGPWGVWAPWYTYPFGSYTGSYGTVPTPPYFAIHPPVYYGPRIRMAYGHSPIARPPLTVVGLDRQEETPEAPLQSGLTIWNPYVADASAKAGQAAAAAKPKAIKNPYYSQKKGKRAVDRSSVIGHR